MYDKLVRQSIIDEYLVGGISFRKLGKKYGISNMTVNRWIWEYRCCVDNELLETKAANLQVMKEENPADQHVLPLAEQIKLLQKQLAQEQLHNRLLTAMIDIAEEELKIPIRKKYGTKQSKK